tara:strand:+ start:1106 stop:1615 length:510 start_codon:yes stop_codon:yes gene_type:complete
MIYLICSARSGSTSLQKYLQAVMPLEKVVKVLIHQFPIEYENMWEYGEDLLKRFPRSYLLDRRDKQAQAESLCFRKLKYGDNFQHYHYKEYYDNLDNDLITESKKYFQDHSKVLEGLSLKYDKKLLYYEDILQENYLKELNIYNKSIYNKFLHPEHKERLFVKKVKTLT